MAAVNSVRLTAEIVLRYVPRERVPQLIEELRAVPGNASFVATIERLERELSSRLKE